MNGMGKNRGFTLIELLVVLFIMVMVAMVGAPKFSNAMVYVELRKSTQELAARLRQARNRSIAESMVAEVRFDLEEQLLRSNDSKHVYQWSEDILVEVANNIPSLVPEPVVIRFYPDGSATDSELVVSAKQRNYVITVDWLTGRVKVL